MRRQWDARLLSHRDDFLEKTLQPLPKLVCGGRGHGARWRAAVIDHVPHHPVRHYFVQRAVHADRFSATTRKRAFHPARHTGDGEVVAEDGNSGLADVAYDGLDVSQMKPLLWSVQQDVVPM